MAKNILFFAIPLVPILFFLMTIFSFRAEQVIKNTSRLKENQGHELFSQWLDYDPKLRIKPEFDRFIYSNVMNGGLGNQMYRFAGLYAMGQLVNRTPIFYKNEEKMQKIDAELAKGFPNFHRRIYFLKEKLNESEMETMDGPYRGCCGYMDTKGLYEYNRRLLKIDGPGSFQNSKYFHHIRPKIIELFEFGEEIVENVNGMIQREFKLDSAYKICVHTRNGDFASLGESRADQVGPAIDRIIGHLPSITNGQIDNYGNYSLVLFGEDQKLLHSLKYNKKSLQSTYFVAETKIGRIGEFYLAKQICNLYLDTASLSSFAFWMGYLMPESRPKFFVRKYNSNHQINTFDQLPAEWFPIEEDWLKI